MLMNYSKYANLPGISRQAQNKNSQRAEGAQNAAVKPLTLDDLKGMTEAKQVTEEIPWPVTCGIVRGTPVFFAQLKGGKRFGVTPVMPKNSLGEVVCPAANGEIGYLTITRSENSTYQEVAGGRIEVSIRPEFANWESVEARTARLDAPKSAK